MAAAIWLDIVVQMNDVDINGQTVRRPNWVGIEEWQSFWEGLKNNGAEEEPKPAWETHAYDLGYSEGVREGFEAGRREALQNVRDKLKSWLNSPPKRGRRS
jgi:hypothetical protein